MRTCHAFVCALVACGGGGAQRVDVPSVQSSESGEYVVYRFSGRALPAPVELHEKVTARANGRVTIEVTATRGHEERRWVQVEADTPDARWDNRVEELYALHDDVRERVPNPDNATLARFYDWMLVSADAVETGHEHAACDQTLASKPFACTCERGTHTMGRHTVHTESSRCPGFAWQRGPSRWTDETGAVVWQVEVTNFR